MGPDDTDPLACSLEVGQHPALPLGHPGDLIGPSPSGVAQEGYFPLRQGGKCVKEFYVAEKTGIPGRYTFECELQ